MAPPAGKQTLEFIYSTKLSIPLFQALLLPLNCKESRQSPWNGRRRRLFLERKSIIQSRQSTKNGRRRSIFLERKSSLDANALYVRLLVLCPEGNQ
jgi:hypothetical protein